MAPRSPPKRVTRARAAATTSSATDNMDAPPRKMPGSKVTKSTSTKKTKATAKSVTELANAEAHISEAPEEIDMSAARNTRSVDDSTKPTRNTRATTAPLAAAPRRRIKVTPLDTAKPQDEPMVETPKEAVKPKKTSRRTAAKSEEDESKQVPSDTIEAESTATKTRSKRKVADEKKDEVAPTVKTRGRPKKVAVTAEEPPEEAAKSTRQTRTRAGSGAAATQPTVASLAKASALPKKKVTFQVEDEDDKENVPIPTRKTTAKKATTTTATGMRARPIRNPATSNTKKKATKKSKDVDQEAAPKPLSPKKPTQINKSATPVESDDEDVLNGGKTPVRDLSLSPKRSVALAARLSPVKKLGFNTVLGGASMEEMSASTMMSPPRRPPPSPARADLQLSPKRNEGLESGTACNDLTAAPALVSGTQSHPALMQSPKRGNVDTMMFSQSVVSPKKSPFKTSLFGSPAKRPTSPAKKSTISSMSEIDGITSPDVMVTSHYRASVSPQRSTRVHRLTEEEIAQELGIDFDESVMNARSPLKIAKPMKFEQVLASEEVKVTSPVADTSSDESEDAMEVSEVPITAMAAEQEPLIKSQNEASSDDEHMDEQTENVGSEDTVIVHAVPVDGASEDPEAEAEVDFHSASGTVEPEELHLNVEALPGSLVHETTDTPRPAIYHLFSDRRVREEDESSEDELATDQTPLQAIKNFRSSLTGRQSLTNAGNIGFTPLAAQMSGWLASSPEKQQNKRAPRGMFSPVAAQHVDGKVVLSRQSTPAQKSPAARMSIDARKSVGLRKSLAARSSLAPSALGSPDKPSFFAEEMAKIDYEENNEQNEGNEIDVEMQMGDDDLLNDVDGDRPESQNEERTVDPDETELVDDQGPGELTTDLINFTHATDTAMVDFAALAQEADELAPEEAVVRTGVNEPMVVEEVAPIPQEEKQSSSEGSVYGDENASPSRTPGFASVITVEAAEEAFEQAPEAAAEDCMVEEPSQELPASLSRSPNHEAAATVLLSIDMVTPVRNITDLKQHAHTVVSKVPLRPEGAISPIKVTKKRSRSLSAGPESASKRRSSPEAVVFLPVDAAQTLTPGRRVRSAAPSPAKSLVSNVTTPGQMSFCVDDFGDSTLDGIEMPDADDTQNLEEVQEESMISVPPSMLATPAPSKQSKSVSATPARTPLKAVGDGILHGATVFVDVHTSEGADASGMFVELLTEMGAKCVKEWRWNPRSSLASSVEDVKAAIGITHVVYKDGGKRTLEKVRDAAGEVCCVGVGWVLDCERESKWLEETPYLIDTSIVPRGGSRRRKSMEPRMLVQQNGNILRVNNGRRSVSGAEMTEQMKQELVNTPARGRESLVSGGILSQFGESDISSTYDSPTTTMNVNMGEDFDQDNEVMHRFMAPTPGRPTQRADADDEAEEGSGMATPTALIGWDPATSQTPITPKLVKKGEEMVRSAPAKQTTNALGGKEDGDVFVDGEKGDNGKKLKVKMGEARRKTLGADLGKWKPRVGSPLAK